MTFTTGATKNFHLGRVKIASKSDYKETPLPCLVGYNDVSDNFEAVAIF